MLHNVDMQGTFTAGAAGAHLSIALALAKQRLEKRRLASLGPGEGCPYEL